MKIFRKANTVGALMIAAGAVITGASVTSGAMASEDAGRTDSGNAVVVGTAGVGGPAEAYQCAFDGVELSQLDAVPAVELNAAEMNAETSESVQGSTAVPAAPLASQGSVDIEAGGVAGPGGTESIEGTDAGRTPEGDATSFQVTVGEDGTNVRGPVSGPAGAETPIEVSGLGIDGSGNVVSVGTVETGGTIPAEAIEVADVREGTEEECAALMSDLQQSSMQSVEASTDAVTKTAP